MNIKNNLLWKRLAISAMGLSLASGALGLVGSIASAAPFAAENSSRPHASTWQEIGEGSPILYIDSQPGIVHLPTFTDVSKPKLMTAAICNRDKALVGTWTDCRPATSFDQGASWVIHDSPNFAEIKEKGWGWGSSTVTRSSADPKRLYFSVTGEPSSSPTPNGGLWRSDDWGKSWTNNLVGDQPGEAGMMWSMIADPFDADTLYVNRGYDYGNVSVSHDAGASFEIICGNNNVSKTVPDAHCASAATWVINFTTQEFYYKHHFISEGVRVNFDGSNIRQYPFAGLTSDSSAVSGLYMPPELPYGQILQYDTPIRGLSNRAGAHSVRFTADGSAMLYMLLAGADGGGFGKLWKASPDFSNGAEITNVTLGGGRLILTHPREACTWIVQSSDTQLQRTKNCGKSWLPISTDGLTDTSPIISAAFAPDYSGALIVFTKEGRRFKSRQNAF
ncbi:MAG: hypothetical protein ACXW1W_10515 [Methylococcaceae bacterium]